MKRSEVVEKTIGPAIDFIKKIRPSDKVAIVHGHDCDAICSAAIFFKLLKKYCKVDPKLVASDLNFSFGEKALKSVERLKTTHTIVLDISEINVLDELKKISKVMIIDHHIPKEYFGVVYCNPRVYNITAYLPTSYLSYKIYESLLNGKEIAWIAGIGTLADRGMENCEDLFEILKSVDSRLVGKSKNIDRELVVGTLLGRLTKILDSGKTVKGKKGSITALNILIEVKDFDEILSCKTRRIKNLIRWYEKSEKEFKKLVEDFRRNKKEVKNLVVYEVKSKLDFKSPLATHLSRFLDNKILAVYQKRGRFFEFSFRKGEKSKVDLDKLVREALKGIPNSSGGGHPSAAGARIPVKYLKKFISNLLG